MTAHVASGQWAARRRSHTARQARLSACPDHEQLEVVRNVLATHTAELGSRFDALVVEVGLYPRLQVFHDGSVVALVAREALCVREAL